MFGWCWTLIKLQSQWPTYSFVTDGRREWATKIDALIRSAGYTTWWDHTLQIGERTNDKIDTELRLAKAAIVICRNELGHRRGSREALFARDLGRDYFQSVSTAGRDRCSVLFAPNG